MSLVPALCVLCRRVRLAPLAQAASDEAECDHCRGALRVVPGCSYGEPAREAFTELSDVISEAQVTPAEARILARQVQPSSWAGGYAGLIDRMCQRMPGLVAAQMAVGNNPIAQRRLMAMLKTILEALATANRGSAEYPILGAASEIPVSTRQRGGRGSA